MRLHPLLLITLTLLPCRVAAQQGMAGRIDAVRAATAAGDHARAITLADALVAWAPEHPNAVLTRAIALGAAGRDSAAANAVRRLMGWDPRYAVRALGEPPLAGVRALLRDIDLEREADRAGIPIARGHVWATIEERDLVAEGTAWDPATGSFLVGSLNRGKVAAVAPDGTVTDRVASGAHGLRSVAGIHVDSLRGVLWVTSNARYDDPADTAAAALFAFDAATGAFRRRIAAPAPTAFLNDLTTGTDGTVYVTDSRGPFVYLLRPGATVFDTLTAAGPLAQPNGITISSDGRHLFLSDLDHVQVVALDTHRSWRLAVPDSITMAGVDGLAFAEGALIAHHPLAFWRIVRYEVDAVFTRVAGREYIERNTPDARTSTTGEVVGDAYYYIGNGQLDRMNAGSLDAATMEPIRLYRAPLRPGQDGLVAVALSAHDSVAFFDPASLERMATLPAGSQPHELTTGADGRTLYVADAGGSTITVVDVSVRPRIAATWRLPDGIAVHDVAVDADGTVWAASGTPAIVFGLDADVGAVEHRYALQRDGSWMLDAHGPGGALVVANLEGAAVTLLDRETGREVVLEGAEGEIDAQATPDGREIWSVNFRSGELTVFETASGRVLRRVQSGAGAGRIVFTPDGRTGLVVHGDEGSVAAYDVATGGERGRVDVGADPKVIALSPDGRRAWLTHPRGALTVLDVAALTVLRTVELAGTPDGVAYVPAAAR